MRYAIQVNGAVRSMHKSGKCLSPAGLAFVLATWGGDMVIVWPEGLIRRSYS